MAPASTDASRLAAFADSHLPWRVNVAPGASLDFTVTQAGRHSAVSCSLDGLSAERDSREIDRTRGEFIALLLVHRGRQSFGQSGRTATVSAGGALLWDSTCPAVSHVCEPIRKTTVFLPRADCQAVLPGLDRLVASPLPPTPTLRLLFEWVEHSYAHSGLDATATDAIGKVTLDLLSAATSGTSSELILDQRDVLLRQVRRFIVDHLADAELDVATIAIANSVSARYLHLLFQRSGDTCRQFILRERLSAADHLLRNVPGMSITEIAHRCGFADPSSFSRAYRRERGRPPKDTRSTRTG